MAADCWTVAGRIVDVRIANARLIVWQLPNPAERAVAGVRPVSWEKEVSFSVVLQRHWPCCHRRID